MIQGRAACIDSPPFSLKGLHDMSRRAKCHTCSIEFVVASDRGSLPKRCAKCELPKNRARRAKQALQDGDSETAAILNKLDQRVDYESRPILLYLTAAIGLSQFDEPVVAFEFVGIGSYIKDATHRKKVAEEAHRLFPDVIRNKPGALKKIGLVVSKLQMVKLVGELDFIPPNQRAGQLKSLTASITELEAVSEVNQFSHIELVFEDGDG